MFEQPLGKMLEPRKLLTAAPGTSVREAARQMRKKNVGAVLVVEDERLLGIFTERDAVFRVVAAGLDPDATTIGTAMTRNPKCLGPHHPFGLALYVMQQNGFRHVPVVADGKPIGIVSSRSAMDPDMEEFVAESRRRDRFSRMLAEDAG